MVFVKKESAIMILLNLCLSLFYNHNAIADEQPNIILIVADDLGY